MVITLLIHQRKDQFVSVYCDRASVVHIVHLMASLRQSASAQVLLWPTPLCRRDTNELWIASAAYAMNSTLVTADKDFDHLQPKHISIGWIDPEQFRES